MNLKDVLSEFHGASNEPELQQMFRELAPSLLYGGYIQVRDDYEVYIRTVEFYFHSEKADGVHDPIVYHRNGRDLDTANYGFNTQSTYLYSLLNGFALGNGNDVRWKDKPRQQSLSVTEKKRQNVYQYDADGNKVKCERLWSFTREEQL